MFNRGKKSSAPEPEQESILNYDDNFPIIDRDGIQPAINLFEGGDAKDSFKSTEYIRIYDLVFKMCIQREPFNYSGRLYTSYTTSIEQYCKNFHDAALTQAVSTTNDISLLRCWGTRWEKQKNVIMGVARLFTYLDRFHTQSTEAILPLANQGHAIYHQHVFDKFAPMVIKAIVRSIDRERNEEDVDRKLLHKAVISFEEMGTWVDKKLKIYKDLLEVKILQNASEFYRRTSRNWIQEDSTPQYLRKAEAMLAQEKTRVESYLNKCS